MIEFCPLASGSKGNCLYYSTGDTKLLIDAGLSARATASKLAQIDVDIADIDAILISHEHADHIAGLQTLAKKLAIPVLANNETAKGIYDYFGECPKFKIFTTGEPFDFQDITIHPFSVQHDTADPVAFTLTSHSIKTGICTDLGIVTTLVEHHLQHCDLLLIEANHEPSMVHASARPMIYKKRVLGRSGHLSNESCGQLLSKIIHPHLQHVYLAHLSSECNTHEKAEQVVKSHLPNPLIPLSIAPQNQIGHRLKIAPLIAKNQPFFAQK